MWDTNSAYMVLWMWTTSGYYSRTGKVPPYRYTFLAFAYNLQNICNVVVHMWVFTSTELYTSVLYGGKRVHVFRITRVTYHGLSCVLLHTCILHNTRVWYVLVTYIYHCVVCVWWIVIILR